MAFLNGAGQAINNVVSGAGQMVGNAVSSVVEVGRAVGTPATDARGSAGVLRLDPDQVDDAIKIFEDARTKLEDRVRDCTGRMIARPCARDEVSQDAADGFNRAGYGGGDTALTVWRGAIEEIQSVIDQLKAVKETTVRTDQANSDPLNSGLRES